MTNAPRRSNGIRTVHPLNRVPSRRRWERRTSRRENGQEYVSNGRGLRIWLNRRILLIHLERLENDLSMRRSSRYTMLSQRILFPSDSDFSDWVMFWSERRDRPYLWNSVTQITRWL